MLKLCGAITKLCKLDLGYIGYAYIIFLAYIHRLCRPIPRVIHRLHKLYIKYT
jgi:hypothetical protein